MLSLVNETLRKKETFRIQEGAYARRCVHVGDLVRLCLTPVEEAVRCGSRRIVCSPEGYYFVKSGEMVFFPVSPSRFPRLFASLSLPSFPPSFLSSSLKFALEKERKRLKS